MFPAAALIAIVLAGVSPGPARASDWEVIAEEDGIVVSRRPVDGRGFPQLRSVGEVPGTPYEVLAILLDVPAQVEWRADCVESRLVRKVDTWRSIVYTRTDAPWPVWDREAVVENEVIFIDPPSKGWLVSMQSTRNPLQTLAGLRKRLEDTRGRYDGQIARFPLMPPAE